MGDTEFIRRQLGGMIKERTKSVEEVPAPDVPVGDQSRVLGRGSSLSIDEHRVQSDLGHRILGHAKGAPTQISPEIAQTTHNSTVSIMAEDQAEQVLDWTEMPDDTSEGSHRPLERKGANIRPAELEIEKLTGATAKEGEDAVSDLTPFQQARQRVEESRKAKRVAESSSPEKVDKQDDRISAEGKEAKASDPSNCLSRADTDRRLRMMFSLN